MSAQSEHRTPDGLFYRVVGDGEPLLLLHGLMASGDMFDPLVTLLAGRFRMVIPDLRGHGRSGDVPGPYDVPALAADLDGVLNHAGVARCAVLGYSHGGAVAQQLALTRPSMVEKDDAGLHLRLQCIDAAGARRSQCPPTIPQAIFAAVPRWPHHPAGEAQAGW